MSVITDKRTESLVGKSIASVVRHLTRHLGELPFRKDDKNFAYAERLDTDHRLSAAIGMVQYAQFILAEGVRIDSHVSSPDFCDWPEDTGKALHFRWPCVRVPRFPRSYEAFLDEIEHLLPYRSQNTALLRYAFGKIRVAIRLATHLYAELYIDGCIARIETAGRMLAIWDYLVGEHKDVHCKVLGLNDEFNEDIVAQCERHFNEYGCLPNGDLDWEREPVVQPPDNVGADDDADDANEGMPR